MMGNAEQRLDPGERCVQVPSTSEWGFFVFCFFFVLRKRRRKLCLHTDVCVCTRVRMLGSI